MSDPNEASSLAASAARKSPASGATADFEPRPILKHKDSREDLMAATGNRSRTLSPPSHE